MLIDMPTTARPHTDIRTLPPAGYVEGVYSIVNPQVGTTRAGKPYLKCLLRDATGEVVGRQWSFDEKTIGELSSAGFVWAAGHTQLYNGQVQFIIEQVKPVKVGEEELAALLPTTRRNIDEMFRMGWSCWASGAPSPAAIHAEHASRTRIKSQESKVTSDE